MEEEANTVQKLNIEKSTADTKLKEMEEQIVVHEDNIGKVQCTCTLYMSGLHFEIHTREGEIIKGQIYCVLYCKFERARLRGASAPPPQMNPCMFPFACVYMYMHLAFLSYIEVHVQCTCTFYIITHVQYMCMCICSRILQSVQYFVHY